MIKTLATFPYARDPMHRIVGSAKSGWACALGLQLVRVDPSGAVQSEFLQWGTDPRDSGFQGMVDSDFVLGTTTLAGHYVTIGQFIEGEHVGEGDFGDRYDTFCSYAQLEDGLAGVYLVNPQRYPHPLPFSVFDTFYRPDGGHWWCGRLQYPSRFANGSVAVSYRVITCCRGPGNTLYAFTEHDSSHMIGLLILSPKGNSLEVARPFQEDWLNDQMGDLAPCGEWPRVTAVYDALNDRVLIAYLEFPDREMADPTYPIPGKKRFYGRWIVAEVIDGTARFLGRSEWYAPHSESQRCVLVPMANGGVYFGGSYQNIDSDFAQGFKFATIGRDGQWTPATDTLPYGRLAAHSDDGLIVFSHAGTADKHIMQVVP